MPTPSEVNEIEQRIREIFAILFQIEPQTISDDSSPQTIPTWTSLQHLNLILALEEEFSIRIGSDDGIGMNSFRKVRELVCKMVEPS